MERNREGLGKVGTCSLFRHDKRRGLQVHYTCSVLEHLKKVSKL